MKLTFLPSVLLAALVGGAVGGVVARLTALPVPPAAPLVVEPMPGNPSPPGARARADDAVQRELDELRLALAGVERKLEAFERVPAAAVPQTAPVGSQARPPALAELSVTQQREVHALIEQERSRRAAEVALLRERERVAGIEQQARKLSGELRLGHGDEAFLSDLLLEHSRRRSTLKEEVSDWTDSRQVGALKQAHTELTEWRRGELTRRFGATRGRRIHAML
ncbi:MAG: hypothetical protein CMJ84_10540 [Planctomycetes bacterium]|jgi:hypothetical protein|nr:hypothetical protein [Planctomycetota bacterium]MDP6408605.1 hypothetical protein [Planctomycetota bacterium]